MLHARRAREAKIPNAGEGALPPLRILTAKRERERERFFSFRFVFELALGLSEGGGAGGRERNCPRMVGFSSTCTFKLF